MGQASFSFEIRQIAKPHLEKLAQRTGEGVILGVLDGFDVVYLSVFQGNHPVRVDVQLGERQPANLTSTGVALLAALDDDRITALMPEVFKVRNEKSIRSREELWQAIKLARASGVGLMKGGCTLTWAGWRNASATAREMLLRPSAFPLLCTALTKAGSAASAPRWDTPCAA
jgi:DNA-binding IclR family transcriptional regulator